MTILAFLATIFGVITGLANVPQTIKIFRRRSAHDISIITYITLFTGAIIWLLYGIELQNAAIVIVNTLGGATIFMVIVGWFIYGRD